MELEKTSVDVSCAVPFFSGEDWKERREQYMAELSGKLVDAVVFQMQSEQGWIELAGRRYLHLSSWTNQLWARSQLNVKNPGGLDLNQPVLSASAWNKLGRAIKPEHRRFRGRPATDDRFSVQQLRPMRRRYQVTETNPLNGEEETFWREGVLVGFATYDAYHLLATEGDPLPRPASVNSNAAVEMLDQDLERYFQRERITLSRSGKCTRLLRQEGRVEIAQGSEGEHRVRELLGIAMELAGPPTGPETEHGEIRRLELAAVGAGEIVACRYGLGFDPANLSLLAGYAQQNPQEAFRLGTDIQRRCHSFLSSCDATTARLISGGKKASPDRQAPSGIAGLKAALS